MPPVTTETAMQSSAQVTHPLSIGLVGLGTVGTGVYKILSQYPHLQIKQIAVQNIGKARDLTDLDTTQLITDPLVVANNPEIQILIEVMGGVELAYEVVSQALKNGKHVVTANKALIAKHGEELLTLAKANDVCLMFEAAVAAGIPIIMPLKLSLAANRIQEIVGILNGTTNYMLTKMVNQGWSYAEALKEAQAKGFAEADPTSDVEGHDTSYKIAILSAIAHGKRVDMAKVHCEGITQLTSEELQLAESLGYTVKLVGVSRFTADEKLDVRVHPMLIPHRHPLASIQLENNAIFVNGDAVGDVMFYGKGAGEMPTASAVCGDLLAIAAEWGQNRPMPALRIELNGYAEMIPVSETTNRYFVRLKAFDHPGVIGQVGTACGRHQISIESIVQHGRCDENSASVVLVTHSVAESQMNAALDEMRQSPDIEAISTVLRIL